MPAPLALPGNLNLTRRPSSLSVSTLPAPVPAPATVAPAAQEQGDEDDVEEGGRGKKRKLGAGGNGGTSGAASTAGNTTTVVGSVPEGTVTAKEYRYSGEISQMMFVFGEVQDPLLETVKLVEDIVKGQIVEIITRARQLTHLRGSRYLSADDVIFLIRDDRGKVNRLRTYLSWKDVRKKAKDDEEGGGAEEDIDDADKVTARIRNTMVKLPWELLTPFSDLLKSLPSRQNRGEDEEEQDEDEMQAYQDSMQRLRDADEITKKMTKDEYVHYSDCRQASFTYRKGKRFREFVNFSAYLDVNPNDDIVDILGFLAFEMVRTLCVKSLDVRDTMERSVTRGNHHDGGSNPRQGGGNVIANGGSGRKEPSSKETEVKEVKSSPSKKRKFEVEPEGPKEQSMENGSTETKEVSPKGINIDPLPEVETKQSPIIPDPAPEKQDSPVKQNDKNIAQAPVQAPLSSAAPTVTQPQTMAKTKSSKSNQNDNNPPSPTTPISLFAPPPSARQPLLPVHVLEAFARIQREQAGLRLGGMRNFRGGMIKGRLALV